MAGQERGAAYPALATVFIGDEGDESTWLHELGHIVRPRIDPDSLVRLITAAKEQFPVVTSEQVNDAAHPTTLQPIHLPEGKYLNINRRYCGLDHSGPGQDAENDEIWAILFTEYCGGFEFPPDLRAMLEEIIANLTVP